MALEGLLPEKTSGVKTDVTKRQITRNPIETVRNRFTGASADDTSKSNQVEADQSESQQTDKGPSGESASTAGSSSQEAPNDHFPSIVGPGQSRAEAAAQEFLGRSESERTVRDPITHQLLRNVKDVTERQYEAALKEAAQVSGSLSDSQTEEPRRPSHEEIDTAPKEPPPQDRLRSSGTSAVPAFPYYDPLKPRYQPALDLAGANIRRTVIYPLAVGVGLLLALQPNPKLLAGLILFSSAFAYFVPHIIKRRVQEALDEADAQQEDARSQDLQDSHWPESAEWANKVLAEIWPAIQPEMFDSLRDTLEDVLQANVPSFLTDVKVADFTQGANPLRILSVSLLPDTEWRSDSRGIEDTADEEAKTSRRYGSDALSAEVRAAREDAYREACPQEAMLQEDKDPNDRYVNLSVTFAYRGRPKKHESNNGKEFGMAGDVQMLLHLMAKLGPAAVMLPVKVQLKGLVGVVRLRVHLIASPPFLGQTVISFTSLPRVSIDVVPLKIISLNDIKPLASWIQKSIDSGFATLTAPKSMTLDLASLISSDGVQREIEAIGIVVVTIHQAQGLERADVYGSSDPYALVLWSRTGKPIFSTRVFIKELNPRFGESLAFLVPLEVVKAEEKVGLELFDSDVGQDDFLGSSDIELAELLDRPGKEVRRHEQLKGIRPGTTRGGRVDWSARFLPKAALNDQRSGNARLPKQKTNAGGAQKSAKSPIDDDAETPALEDRLPDGNAKDGPKSEAKQDEQKKRLLPVEYIAPSPREPSGILSINIHEIAALSNVSSFSGRGSIATLSGRTPKTGRAIADEDTTDNSSFDEAPSSYVEIIAEDKLVYRTRTKVSDFRPIFNAVTEKVILNWMTARVLLVVREKKLDEDDPILGIVPVKLAEVFRTSSLCSSWYPIAGGAGSGRLKLSLLFRSVEGSAGRNDNGQSPSSQSNEGLRMVHPVKSPQPVSPIDVGVVHLFSLDITDSDLQGGELQKLANHVVRLKSLSSHAKIASKHAMLESAPEVGPEAPPGVLSGDVAAGTPLLSYSKHLHTTPLRIPIFRRGASPFLIRLDTKEKLLGRKKVDAMAVLWLRDVSDWEVETFKLSLWSLEDKASTTWLRQQYLDQREPLRGEGANDTKDAEAVLHDLGLKVRRIGTVYITLQFATGVSALHGKISDPSGGLPQVCQAWRLAVRKGLVEENTSGDGRVPAKAGAVNEERERRALQETHDRHARRRRAASGATGASGDKSPTPAKDGEHDSNSTSESSSSDSDTDTEQGFSDDERRGDRRRQEFSECPSPESTKSSGSKTDLLKRASRHLSESRHPLTNLTSVNAGSADPPAMGSGGVGVGEDEPKVVRVLDSALGGMRREGERVMNRFDRRKGRKAGAGVESEV